MDETQPLERSAGPPARKRLPTAILVLLGCFPGPLYFLLMLLGQSLDPRDTHGLMGPLVGVAIAATYVYCIIWSGFLLARIRVNKPGTLNRVGIVVQSVSVGVVMATLNVFAAFFMGWALGSGEGHSIW